MSGLLIEHFWWGSVFLVNVPIIAIALIAGRILVPTSRDPSESRLDVGGALLSIAGIGSLVYAIIEAPNHGWMSPTSVVWFGPRSRCSSRSSPGSVASTSRCSTCTTSRTAASASPPGASALVYFAMFGTMFLLTQYFQLVLGYGTLEAGLKQLPFPIVMMAVSPNTPRIAARLGANRMVGAGLAVVAPGDGVVHPVDQRPAYPCLALTMAMLAFGMALTMSPLTASIMSSVPRGKAGVGSAMNDTSREIGRRARRRRARQPRRLAVRQPHRRRRQRLDPGQQGQPPRPAWPARSRSPADLPARPVPTLVPTRRTRSCPASTSPPVVAAVVVLAAAVVAWRSAAAPTGRSGRGRPVLDLDEVVEVDDGGRSRPRRERGEPERFAVRIHRWSHHPRSISMNLSNRSRLAIAAVTLVLVAAACGSDDSSDDDTAAPPPPRPPPRRATTTAAPRRRPQPRGRPPPATPRVEKSRRHDVARRRADERREDAVHLHARQGRDTDVRGRVRHGVAAVGRRGAAAAGTGSTPTT